MADDEDVWPDDSLERWADEEVERWADDEVERWADDEVERWTDDEVERWADEDVERSTDDELELLADSGAELLTYFQNLSFGSVKSSRHVPSNNCSSVPSAHGISTKSPKHAGLTESGLVTHMSDTKERHLAESFKDPSIVTESGLPEGYKNTWYNGPGVPLTSPNPSTRRYLDFYDKRAGVKESCFEFAFGVVNSVLNDILPRANKLRDRRSPIIGNFLRCGSACEGVKAVRPDEFDVLVPLEINEQKHGCSYKVLTYKDDKSIPAGMAMCKLTGRPAGVLGLMCKTGATHKGTFISLEELVLGWFHRLLHEAINQRDNRGKDIQVKVRKKKGPALVLVIKSASNALEPTDTKTIKVDVVPAFRMDPSEADTRFIVATKLFSDFHCFEHKYGADLQKTLRGDFQLYWRISMTCHERAHFAHVADQLGPDSCHIACLKILKAKRWLARTTKPNDKRTICWKYISSYMLKTALFRTIQEKGRRGYWSFDDLPDRIQDILQEVSDGFKKGCLPNFFYNNKSLAREFPDDRFFLEESDGVNLVYPGAKKIRTLVTHNLSEVRHRLDAKFKAVEAVGGESDISDTRYQRHLLEEGPEEDQEVNLNTDCDEGCRAGRPRAQSRLWPLFDL